MSDSTTKQQLVEAKKTVHGADDFHGDVKSCSEKFSELSHEMCWLLDALEKAHPELANSPELAATWKNALSATNLARRLSETVFMGS